MTKYNNNITYVVLVELVDSWLSVIVENKNGLYHGVVGNEMILCQVDRD